MGTVSIRRELCRIGMKKIHNVECRDAFIVRSSFLRYVTLRYVTLRYITSLILYTHTHASSFDFAIHFYTLHTSILHTTHFYRGYFAPYRSPQIFQEYLSKSGIDSLIEPIKDSNMTTARLNGTTIDNPSFGVYAGQQVEILLLNLNEDITTLVVGKDNVQKYTQPLADMTKHIASNQELVERVRNFAEN
jgi:hypothetical protein